MQPDPPSRRQRGGGDEMSELRIGDKIKDNDPRMGQNRVLTIIEIRPNGVVAEDYPSRAVGILRKRIFTDGKPRKYGFNRIAP